MNYHHFRLIFKEVLLELLHAFYLVRLRSGNVHRHGEKLRQCRSGSSHHLVHNLAYGADIHLIQHKFLIRYIHTHEHLDYGLDIPPLKEHDVSAFKTLYISYLYAYGGFNVVKLKFISGLHTDSGCCNINSGIQHDGYRRCRGS